MRGVISVITFLSGLTIIALSLWIDSERSKRIELEVEVAEYRDDIWGKFTKSLWIEGDLLRFKSPEGDSVLNAFKFPCAPDSLLAVPPKDTIVFDSTVDTLGMKPVRKVDTIKLIYTFEVGADGKMKQINP